MSDAKLMAAIELALSKLDNSYYKLSSLVYLKSPPQPIAKAKFLERPIAYEFYHQFRMLLDNGNFNIGKCVLQGEVDKGYQSIFDLDTVPDFIFHVPDSSHINLAVIEFKLATRPKKDFVDDFDKLVKFKKEPLRYENLIEVIIGNNESLSSAKEIVSQLKSDSDMGAEIIVVWFNVATNRPSRETIKYCPRQT